MKPRLRILLTDTYVAAAFIRGKSKSTHVPRFGLSPVTVPSTLLLGANWAPVAAAAQRAALSCQGQDAPADLIIPATWCYSALLDTGARLNSRTLTFALEEYLPIPIEDITTAFATVSPGRHWAVAVRTAPMGDLLAQLDAVGIRVDRVLVDAVQALSPCGAPSDERGVMAILDVRRIELIQQSPQTGVPSRIRALLRPADTPVAEFLAIQSACGPEDVFSNLSRENILDLCLAPDDASATATEDPMFLPDAARALLISEASEERLLDLRTGELAPSDGWQHLVASIDRLAILLVVLLVLLIADQFGEQRRVTAEIDALRQQQVALFQEVLPAVRPSASPAMHLASERRRLAALSGSTGAVRAEESSPVTRAGPINDLRQFVAHLPSEVRVLVLEVNIDEQQIALRGLTADHRDAERISEAVRAIADCSPTPPRTSRERDGGIEFNIRTRRVSHAR